MVRLSNPDTNLSTVPASDVKVTDQIASIAKGDKRMINEYEIGPQIGKGQHGEVLLCYDCAKSGQPVAIKAMRRTNAHVDKMSKLRRKQPIPASNHTPLTEAIGETEKQIRKEIAIMKKCRHPHVVRLLEVIDDKLKVKIYMVMEYLGGGEIKWRNSDNEPILRVDQCRRVIRDVVLGLEYLHYQGIIHRDIKPANLLWSTDRQTVKITDFGVSHFSYAQRLAAVGKGKKDAQEIEAILMDDSALSKTAGTPSFYAPEIISDEPSRSLSQDSLSGTNIPPAPRQITKAIDVWALGVTLYCLLFGTTPFEPPDNSQFTLFHQICHDDWNPQKTMGADKLPTWGRKPRSHRKGTEGYSVNKLLERLLEKDPVKRITLDQIKRHDWITRDLSNRDEWIQQTAIAEDALDVTEQDSKSAMSVGFQWVERSLGTLLKSVRNRNNRQTKEEKKEAAVGVQSAPHTQLRRYKSESATERLRSERKTRPNMRQSNSAMGAVNVHSPNAPNAVAGPSSQRQRPAVRRGSFVQMFPVVPYYNTVSSPSLTPRPSRSPTPNTRDHPTVDGSSSSHTVSRNKKNQQSFHTNNQQYRPRNRFSFQSLKNWRPRGWSSTSPSTTSPSTTSPSNSQSPIEPSTLEQSTSNSPYLVSNTPPGMSVPDFVNPSSDENFPILRGRESCRNLRGSGRLTAGLRASSWGDFIDYPRSEDMISMYSGDRTDDLDELDEVVIRFGAGGIGNAPVSPGGGLMGTDSSVSLTRDSSTDFPTSSAMIGADMAHAVPMNVRETGEDPSAQQDRSHGHQHSRTHTTSPLKTLNYSYDSDDSSVFNINPQRGYCDVQPSTSRRVRSEDQDDGDNDSDDSAGAIQVRRRKKSVK